MQSISSYSRYAAIIGDIIDSRKLSDRSRVQQRFKVVLARINSEYSDDLAAKFTITLGDEFQGLLKSGKQVMAVIEEIEREMAPATLRFGIGIGGVSTEINPENSLEMDGPVYHRAREMMNQLKGKKNQYEDSRSNIMISSGERNRETDELINSILAVCHALKSKWTDRQREIIDVYRRNGENQYQASRCLKIGQPSVNKALKGARFYAYKSAMNNVNSFLSKEYSDSI